MYEGEEYQFRVYAENKAGLSEPSQPSRFKEARPRFMPPKIERTRLKDMTVSAGEMVKLNANIIGGLSADVLLGLYYKYRTLSSLGLQF